MFSEVREQSSLRKDHVAVRTVRIQIIVSSPFSIKRLFLLMVNDFTCKNAMPGIGCGLWEFLFLGLIFYGAAFVSLYYFKAFIPTRTTSFGKLQLLLWLFLFIWFLYKGTLFIVPFSYNQLDFRIFYISFPALLYIIPVTLFIRLICEVLFTYNSPGIKLQAFIKVLVGSFISIYSMIGIALSIGDVKDTEDPGSSISLWYGCMNFLTIIFVATPAIKLIDLVNGHGTKEYKSCAINSRIGLLFFIVLYGVRGLYNTFSYFSLNPLQNFLNIQLSKVQRYPPSSVRVVSWFYYFFFDGVSAFLFMAGAVLLNKHIIQLSNDPFIARQVPSDAGLI